MEGYITIGTELETKQFDKQILDLERKINDLEKIINSPKDIGLNPSDIQDAELELEKTKNKLIQVRKQQEKIKQEQQNINEEARKNVLDTSFGKAIKKASKLALAIFGIRSAYLFLRRASSDLATYDDQYATNLEYIRFVLTQAIAPVLQYIVNLAMQLLQYVNAIIQAWFGINLFANGSVEAFQKMKEKASGVSSAVKEIKKQLLGFDEINVLTDQSDTGTSAGASGVGIPSMDLSSIQGNIPEWLQWIIDNKDLAIKGLEGIATALIALKYGLGLVKGVGLFLIIDGIVELIKHLKEFSDNPSISNFADIIYDIGEAVVGLGIVFSNVDLGIVGLLAIAIGDVTKAIGDLIDVTKNPNKNNFSKFIKSALNLFTVGRAINDIVDGINNFLNPAIDETTEAIKETTEAEKDLKEATEDLINAQDRYANSIDRLEQAQNQLTEAQNKTGISGEALYKLVEQGTLDYKNMTEEQKEVYKAYLNTMSAEQNLKETTDKLTEAKKNEKLASLESKLAVANETKQFDDYKKAVVDAFNKGEISSEEARDLITKSLNGISEESRETFVQDLPYDIKSGLNPDNYQSTANRFIRWWNDIFMDSLTTKLRLTFEGNFTSGGGAGFGGGSGGGRAHGGIFYPSKIPFLANGGIVNFPGSGAFYNGAYIGERGAEAVVPLTDNQQMELLGATIGRYITVNANIVNTMNGRVISRELKQIQNEQDFAYNT